MKSLTIKSPAKINLYLHVKKKRKDGFHEIKTVFQRISLHDEITLKSNKSGRISIRCNHPHVPTGPKNLVYQVAQMLKRELDIPKGVHISIKKRIPVAAGLAGGSSNAGTVLLGLNRLWRLNLSKAQLVKYADRIGSDVAFFIHNTPWALGTDRGNKIKRLSIRTKLWQILVVPRVKMLSGRVYGGLNLSLTKGRDNANILIHNLKKRNILGIKCSLKNDLEGVVFRLCPRLAKLQLKLKSFDLEGVMVSGSGPAVFGITDSEEEARTIYRKISKQYSQSFVVCTLLD